MACPTCDHTMQSVGQLVNDGRIYWCPRCGTLRWREHGKETDSVPTLPGRVRLLVDNAPLYINADGLKFIHVTGIDEGCRLPKGVQ